MDENKCDTPIDKVIDHIDKDGWTTLINAIAFVIKWGGLALVFVAGLAEFAVLFLYSWQWLTTKFPL